MVGVQKLRIKYTQFTETVACIPLICWQDCCTFPIRKTSLFQRLTTLELLGWRYCLPSKETNKNNQLLKYSIDN